MALQCQTRRRPPTLANIVPANYQDHRTGYPVGRTAGQVVDLPAVCSTSMLRSNQSVDNLELIISCIGVGCLVMFLE